MEKAALTGDGMKGTDLSAVLEGLPDTNILLADKPHLVITFEAALCTGDASVR